MAYLRAGKAGSGSYIPVSVTLYGAPNAIITWTNADSTSGYCQLNGSGTKANVSVVTDGHTAITFTDTTISKNPSNLSASYTKSVVVLASTTSIYIMPDNCLYWYGWENTDVGLGGGFKATTQNGGVATKETNDLLIQAVSATLPSPDSNKRADFRNNNLFALNAGDKANCIVKVASNTSYGLVFKQSDTVTVNNPAGIASVNSYYNEGTCKKDITISTSGNYGFYFYNNSGSIISSYVYAVYIDKV